MMFAPVQYNNMKYSKNGSGRCVGCIYCLFQIRAFWGVATSTFGN